MAGEPLYDSIASLHARLKEAEAERDRLKAGNDDMRESLRVIGNEDAERQTIARLTAERDGLLEAFNIEQKIVMEQRLTLDAVIADRAERLADLQASRKALEELREAASAYVAWGSGKGTGDGIPEWDALVAALSGTERGR
jgi:chromosome segregation ATPase